MINISNKAFSFKSLHIKKQRVRTNICFISKCVSSADLIVFGHPPFSVIRRCLFLLYWCIKEHFCNPFFPASDLLSESSWILIYELFKTLRIQLEFLEFFVWIGDSPWLVCLLLFRLIVLDCLSVLALCKIHFLKRLGEIVNSFN